MAGSVRRTSIPMTVPRTNAKAAYPMGTTLREANVIASNRPPISWS
jgi:hypothetical protein